MVARQVVGAVALALLSRCGSDTAEPGRGQAVGNICTAALPCETYLLCLAGRCVARPEPPRPEQPPLPDAVSPDIARPDDVAAETTEPDSDDAVAADSDTDPTDAMTQTRTVLGPHDALLDPSDTRLGLVLGQAAVREVLVPGPADVLGVEAVLRAPDGTAGACAKYEVALWAADGTGAFPVAPTFRSPALLAVAAADPVWLELPERVAVPAGALRFGLIYGGPCELSFPPWIALDRSGQTADTFIWANVWIPAAALELEGRWGLSLAISSSPP